MTTTVRLTLYDISQGMARQFGPMLGVQLDYLPHTGILVFGKEFFFGGGIQEMRHEDVIASFGLRPVREPEVLGRTERTREEFIAFLASIRTRFTASTYDLLGNNCNHFTDACARFLLQGSGIPDEIVSLPNIVLQSPVLGPMLRPLLTSLQTQMQGQFSAVTTIMEQEELPRPTLLSSLTALNGMCATPIEHLAALTTLHRLVKNIILHPHEAKYRRVSVANASFQKSLGRHAPHGVNCVLGLGFELDRAAGLLVLEASEEKWTKLVWGEKIVANARTRAIRTVCQGVQNKEDALSLLFGEGKREDELVLSVVREIFET